MSLQQEKVIVSVLQLADDWIISYAKIAGERLRPTRFQRDLYPLMEVVSSNNLTFRQFRLPLGQIFKLFPAINCKIQNVKVFIWFFCLECMNIL